MGEFISNFLGRLTKGTVFPRNVFYLHVLSGCSSPFAQTLHFLHGAFIARCVVWCCEKLGRIEMRDCQPARRYMSLSLYHDTS